MRSLRGLFVAVFALLAALPLAADVRAQLEAPKSGTVLRGGTTAAIEWSARGLPRFAEEWEAFLSADGGRHFAYRITPHLDLDQRRFVFDVPNVETDDARILIRAGDEHREIELELLATFAIRQDRFRAAASAPATLDDDRRGEPARAGEAGVIEWVDGDRDGGHLTPRSALRHEAGLRGTARLESTTDAAEAAAPLPLLAPLAARTVAHIASASRVSRVRGASAQRGRDVLLAGRRLNL